jgi:hypothetical protein
VKLDGDRPLGALIDGQGRFKIPGVPSGLLTFDVAKPGFHSPGDATADSDDGTRFVRAATGMPEIEFSLAPDHAISGHVRLSTGVPAEGIGIELLRQSNSSGRHGWQMTTTTLSTPEGDFRFHGLGDGTFLVMTQPEFENINAHEPACSAESPPEIEGYASIFYGGSDSLASATRIEVNGGRTAEVNLTLNLTKFYLVQVRMQHIPTSGDWTFTHTLLDHNGQVAQYPIHEEKDHTLCSYLPDGAYTLAEDASPGEEASGRPNSAQKPAAVESPDRAGLLEFSVEGRAERDLRMALAQGSSTPIYLHYEPGPRKPPELPIPEAAGAPNEETVIEDEFVPLRGFGASRANGIPGEEEEPDLTADEVDDHTYSFGPAPPGAYWVRTNGNTPGTCLGEVTSGGQDLAQSPWVVGSSGAGAPIDIVVRTDCATLNLEMPPTLAEESTGEGTTLHVYAIPEFASITGALIAELRQFGGREQKLEGITPGTYRVFAFRTPRSIEYHNPAALAQLGAGQEITLEPGDNATLVVQEVPQ